MNCTGNTKKSKEVDELLNGLAELPYYERLTRFIRGSTRHLVAAGGVTVVNFRPLYAVTVHHLQRQLAEEIRRIEDEHVTGEQLDHITETLQNYSKASASLLIDHFLTVAIAAQALRDFEFIHDNRWSTHFVKDIAASRLDNGQGSRLQAALISELGLEAHGSHSTLFHDSDLLGSFNHKLMQHNTSLGQSLGTGRARIMASETRRIQLSLTLKRFAFAIVGGLIIVVPMLILVAGSVTPKTLTTITSSIFLFAVSVAALSQIEPESLLVATAAYAAVLVALIGTGNGDEVQLNGRIYTTMLRLLSHIHCSLGSMTW